MEVDYALALKPNNGKTALSGRLNLMTMLRDMIRDDP